MEIWSFAPGCCARHRAPGARRSSAAALLKLFCCGRWAQVPWRGAQLVYLLAIPVLFWALCASSWARGAACLRVARKRLRVARVSASRPVFDPFSALFKGKNTHWKGVTNFGARIEEKEYY
ncbi:hypothetical protein A2U01_0048271 [Trifolium medium]|uniref:Uncharacterized protein n=1 Tax=Trifolium medium TaxID=97028 RepID=A0A392QRQ6_9FABA|nr:hypothetical protein [Trifolium medium]